MRNPSPDSLRCTRGAASGDDRKPAHAHRIEDEARMTHCKTMSMSRFSASNRCLMRAGSPFGSKAAPQATRIEGPARLRAVQGRPAPRVTAQVHSANSHFCAFAPHQVNQLHFAVR